MAHNGTHGYWTTIRDYQQIAAQKIQKGRIFSRGWRRGYAEVEDDDGPSREVVHLSERIDCCNDPKTKTQNLEWLFLSIIPFVAFFQVHRGSPCIQQYYVTSSCIISWQLVRVFSRQNFRASVLVNMNNWSKSPISLRWTYRVIHVL